MVDYIFCRNLKKADLIDEIKSFYKSDFELTDYQVKMLENKVFFRGIVKPDLTKTEAYADVVILGSIDAKNIKWMERDWDKTYICSSEPLVSKVQKHVADDLKKHYQQRGYITLDDFSSNAFSRK